MINNLVSFASQNGFHQNWPLDRYLRRPSLMKWVNIGVHLRFRMFLPMTSSAKFLARVFFSKATQVSPLGKKHRVLSIHCTHQMSTVRNAKVSNSRIFDFNFRCKENFPASPQGWSENRRSWSQFNETLENHPLQVMHSCNRHLQFKLSFNIAELLLSPISLT